VLIYADCIKEKSLLDESAKADFREAGENFGLGLSRNFG
jgi:hypothetical protein